MAHKFRPFGHNRRSNGLPPEFHGAQNLSQTPAVALDRLGRELVKGALVLMEHNATDIVFEVTDVRSITLPNAPQGAMQVTLAATIPITMNRATPSPRLFVLQHPPADADDEDATAATTDDPPPPDEGQPT